MTLRGYTQRQKDAVVALHDAVADCGGPVTPSAFAMFFWPGKKFARGNGPWGLGPDASGRHGGRMLNRLYRMGLAKLTEEGGGLYYTASLTHEGMKLWLAITEQSSGNGMQDE